MSVPSLLKILKEEISKSEKAGFIRRIISVILSLAGFSPIIMARELGISSRTLSRWVLQYQLNGVDGLRGEKCGRSGSLDEENLRQLAQDIAHAPQCFGYEGEFWNGHLLREHLAQHFGISLGLRQCQRLLARLRQEIEASPSLSHLPHPH
jgi:transposase